MADDDVVDFASTCRAHVPAAGDTVIPSRPHRAGKVGEFRAVHGRAGMAILCTGQGGRPRAGGEATAAHEAAPGWAAPLDVASLVAEQHSAWPSDPYDASGTYPELWVINGPGF